jgi:alkylation response protein AidB-like acyl-CoA dehydrogenase
MKSVGAHRQYEIEFRDVKVPESQHLTGAAGGGALSEALDWATVAQCGEMVGRAERVLEMVVDYSKSRVQFGRPIGSFQAVQHRCADLRVAVDGARLLTHQAAWKLSRGTPAGEDVSMAKAYCGSLSRRATEAGHSIFAGIAFAREHDMHLYTARSKISEANLGDTDAHLARIGKPLAP